MTLADILIPTYLQMLGALSRWLDKTQDASGGEAEALLAARIAPDMFPLSTQVRFACAQAQEGVFRLRDMDFAPSVDELRHEGLAVGERAGSIADAQARIDETLALVWSFAPDADDARGIAHDLPTGMVLDLTADRYVRDWALPQFYFHVVAAYAILRNAGVDLGKADRAAHMFAYLRPGTADPQ